MFILAALVIISVCSIGVTVHKCVHACVCVVAIGIHCPIRPEELYDMHVTSLDVDLELNTAQKAVLNQLLFK